MPSSYLTKYLYIAKQTSKEDLKRCKTTSGIIHQQTKENYNQFFHSKHCVNASLSLSLLHRHTHKHTLLSAVIHSMAESFVVFRQSATAQPCVLHHNYCTVHSKEKLSMFHTCSQTQTCELSVITHKLLEAILRGYIAYITFLLVWYPQLFY